MRILQRCVWPVVGLALLAGCAQSNTNYERRWMAGAYSGTDLEARSGGKDLRTTVVGTLFEMDQAAFSQAITDTMTRNMTRGDITFTSTPGPDASPIRSVVMVFNPTTDVTREELCRSPESVSGGGPGEDIVLASSYCGGDEPLTFLRARLNGGASGVDDPAFEQFIRGYLIALFPLLNPKNPLDQ